MTRWAATLPNDSSGGSGTTRSVPAWLLSVVVHLLALLLMAIFFKGVATALPGEGERSVAIVLARATERDSVEYFDEESAASASASFSEPAATQSALPTEAIEAPPVDADIKLPGLPDANIGASLSDDLVQVPTLSEYDRKALFPGSGDAAIFAEEALRSRPSGPTGRSANIGVFGSQGVTGHSFVFVIDRSKSMGGEGLGALGAAAKELYAALSTLEDHHEFQIIAYNHSTLYVDKQRKLLNATDENKAKVPPFFNTLAAFGQTSHETALLSALRLKPDVIFFLNDGGDPYLNEIQMQRINERARGQTSIHCFLFGFRPPDENNFMSQLARQNSGSYQFIDMSK